METLVKNVADEQQVKAAAKTERWTQRQALEDWRALLALPAGRRVLWGLLEECGVFRTSWHPSALIHFNEGKRDVGLQILSHITAANDEALLQMMRENKQETTHDDRHERRTG